MNQDFQIIGTGFNFPILNCYKPRFSRLGEMARQSWQEYLESRYLPKAVAWPNNARFEISNLARPDCYLSMIDWQWSLSTYRDTVKHLLSRFA